MVEVSKKSWKEKVLEFSNLGEDANLDSFHREFIQDLEVQINKAEANISATKTNLKNFLFEEEILLAELKRAESTAYINIDAEKIKNQALRKQYREVFKRQIEDAASAVATQEEIIENAKLDADKAIKKNEKTIEAYKAQIGMLS